MHASPPDAAHLTDDLVVTLLTAQGFEVPADDLREIADTARSMLEQALAWDALEPFDHEPWSHWFDAERSAAERRAPPTSEVAAGAASPEAHDSSDLAFADASEQAAWLRAGGSAVTLTRTYLERIERLDAHLRTFITVTAERALHAAERADAELRAGRVRSPLHGIPFAVKDQMLIDGVRLTGGSRVLRDVIGERTATVVARLEEAGAVLLGTLNTHEFHAGPTRNFPFSAARNPWDTERSPGGSSSGSAAAVAAGLCTFSLGGDTGGSIRGPAAVCSLVGLKPTWGRVSRDGMIPLTWSLDCVGPLARSTRDVAAVLRVIAGPDERDPTASHARVDDYAAHLGAADLRGLRVGVIDELMDPRGINNDAIEASRAAIDALRELGASVTSVSVPLLPTAGQVCNALVLVEAASHHRRWLRDRYLDYDINTRVGFLAGAVAPGLVAAHASRMRTAIAKQIIAHFDRMDVLAGPSAGVAHRLDAPRRRGADRGPGGVPVTPLTQPFNLAGVPALSVPCGFDPNGLPLGLQLATPHFDEATLLRVADAYERATPWRGRRPALG